MLHFVMGIFGVHLTPESCVRAQSCCILFIHFSLNLMEDFILFFILGGVATRKGKGVEGNKFVPRLSACKEICESAPQGR